MGGFETELNGILVEAYHSILKMEELTLTRNERLPLSINEMHLIECVGKGGDSGRTVSELAEALYITRPSATVAVGKLEKKGYVKKSGCENDGRVVRVYLTRQGKKADGYHRYYHRRMVRELSCGMTDEEKNCLIKAVRKLNAFFRDSIGEEV